MTEPFRTTFRVRIFEIDPQGHLTGSAYLDYANQALWEHLTAAGVDVTAMFGAGAGPVNLETNIRYLSELRVGERFAVTCELRFGTGKTYDIRYAFLREDGAPAAEVTSVFGILDLKERRLIADPAGYWRRTARDPALLGIAD